MAKTIALNCPVLECLEIHNARGPKMTNSGVQELLKNCKQMKTLFLPDSELITLECFKGLKSAGQLPKLEHLRFIGRGEQLDEVYDFAVSAGLKGMICLSLPFMYREGMTKEESVPSYARK